MIVVISLLMTTTTFLDVQSHRSHFRHELELQALLLADTLNDVLANDLYFGDVDDLYDISNVVLSQQDVVYVRVFLADGRLVVDTDQEGSYPSGTVGREFVNGDRKNRGIINSDGRLLEAVAPVEVAGQLIGGVQIGFSATSVDAQIRKITIQRVWQSLGLMALGIVLSYIIAQYYARPVRRLVAATEMVAEGEFDYPTGGLRHDEIGELSRSFAKMTRSLQASTVARQERTTALAAANVKLNLEIEERTKAEEALRESEQRFRTVFESAPIGMVTVDDGPTFTRTNRALQTMLGYGAEDLTTMTIADVTHPEDMAEIAAMFAELTEGKRERYWYEKRNITKDGSVVWAQVAVSTLSSSADRFEAMAMLQDVTERHRAEEALRASTVELERSNKELEHFASVAAHDLQEPLRKIQMFGDRLRAKSGDALGDEGRDSLERMQGAARRMSTLVSDLLTLSRVSTQGQPYVPVDLSEVASEVLSDQETRIEEKEATVDLGELPTIEADPTQMRQLLQNLIGNALKFSRPGEPPIVTVKARVLEASRQQPETCLFTVEDNGIGFDEKNVDRIFTMFQRLHGRNEFEGTGVGLAICRRIVERHGGDITADSEPGRGSKFIVKLPVAQPSHEEVGWKGKAPQLSS